LHRFLLSPVKPYPKVSHTPRFRWSKTQEKILTLHEKVRKNEEISESKKTLPQNFHTTTLNPGNPCSKFSPQLLTLENPTVKFPPLHVFFHQVEHGGSPCLLGEAGTFFLQKCFLGEFEVQKIQVQVPYITAFEPGKSASGVCSSPCTNLCILTLGLFQGYVLQSLVWKVQTQSLRFLILRS
jgi:hypothetical protein